MESKVCTRCKVDKPLTEYFKTKRSKDGLQPACKSCMNISYKASRGKKVAHYNAVQKQRELKKAAWLQEYKQTQRCLLCPEDDSSCLDFHHVDPLTKDGDVSDIVRGVSLEKLQRELDKCVMLCSNCHRKLHANKLTLL